MKTLGLNKIFVIKESLNLFWNVLNDFYFVSYKQAFGRECV